MVVLQDCDIVICDYSIFGRGVIHYVVIGDKMISFDGDVSTQNTNRSNSASLVDLDYFRDTWPESSVKMTISTDSLKNLCNNVVFINS